MPEKTPRNAEPQLEQTVERLEQIVSQLESGEANLEKSIELYLEGKKLGGAALKKLDSLERRIQIVSGEDADGLKLEPFDEEIEP